MFIKIVILDWLLHPINYSLNWVLFLDTILTLKFNCFLDFRIVFLRVRFCIENINCSIFIYDQEFIYILFFRTRLEPFNNLDSSLFHTRGLIIVVPCDLALLHQIRVKSIYIASVAPHDTLMLSLVELTIVTSAGFRLKWCEVIGGSILTNLEFDFFEIPTLVLFKLFLIEPIPNKHIGWNASREYYHAVFLFFPSRFLCLSLVIPRL